MTAEKLCHFFAPPDKYYINLYVNAISILANHNELSGQHLTHNHISNKLSYNYE